MIETMWRRNDDWVGSEVEDSFVMINIESGIYVVLNASAKAVWDQLAIPRTQRDVEASLLSQYDVPPETCAKSVTKLLRELQDLQLANMI